MSLVELPRLLTAAEAAKHLRVSVRTIRRLVDGGRLVPIRLAEQGPMKFDVRDLATLIERSRAEAE